MSEEPDYVVVRRGLDMPDEWLMPDGLEGRWFDRAQMKSTSEDPGHIYGTRVVATPTGRFEVRDDGAVAEIWEIRPGYR